MFLASMALNDHRTANGGQGRFDCTGIFQQENLALLPPSHDFPALRVYIRKHCYYDYHINGAFPSNKILSYTIADARNRYVLRSCRCFMRLKNVNHNNALYSSYFSLISILMDLWIKFAHILNIRERYPNLHNKYE